MSEATDLGGADCPGHHLQIFTVSEEDEEVTQSLIHLYEICCGLGLQWRPLLATDTADPVFLNLNEPLEQLTSF